eukprot:Selendium_serpulae@DN5696_c0_g1_i1.p1
MLIDRVTLIVWCSFVLDKMHIFGDYLKLGLRILMASGRLELKGAPIQLVRETIHERMRGSLAFFLTMIHGRYNTQILQQIGVLLGHSSLANIPRIPLDVMRNTTGVVLSGVNQASAGIGTILANMTFDPEYINRRQKERVSNKGSGGVREGFAYAGRNVADGLMSLTNVFTKPYEGAQKEGLPGFMKGIGKGVVGTLAKPVDKAGQAISNIATGIKAEYMSKPLGGYKMRTTRRRKPRMLWGEFAQLFDYNVDDAELRECLGLSLAKNVVKCITLKKQGTRPATHLALIFYPRRIFYADLYGGARGGQTGPLSTSTGKPSQSSAGSSGHGGPSGASGNQSEAGIVGDNDKDSDEGRSPHREPGRAGGAQGGRARCIWRVDVASILEARASSHGVVLRVAETRKLPAGSREATERAYQVPIADARLIQAVHQEINRCRSGIKSEIVLSKDMPVHFND